MNPSIVHLILCQNRCMAFVVPSISLPSLSRKTTTARGYNHCSRRQYNSFSRLSSSIGQVGDFDISGNPNSVGIDRLNRHINTGDSDEVRGHGTMYKVKADGANSNKWIHVSFDVADDTTATFAQPGGKGQKKRKGVNNTTVRPASKPVVASSRQLIGGEVSTTSNNKAQDEISTHTSSSTAPSSSTASSSDSIPESVLQYERQLRKLRASDRASKTNVNIQDHLHTVHVDEHIVVVNKPSGILCVPGVNGHRSMLDLVYEVYGYGTGEAAAAAAARAEDTVASEGVNERQSKVSSNDRDPAPPPLSKDSMIVHRLDMDTSGIVIFARTRTAMAKLHESFRDRTGAKKTYEALLVGWLEIDKWIDVAQHNTASEGGAMMMVVGKSSDEDDAITKLHSPLGGGEINLPLQRDHKHPPFMRVSTLESEAEAQQAVLDLNNAGYAKLMAKRPKPSTTQFHILSHELWMGQHPVTRVQLLPITGRTHQLRVHCAALGHPILGDPAYGYCGEAHANGGFSEDELKRVSPTFASFELRRDVEDSVRESGRTMCLHARKLMLDHPATKERVSFEVAPSF